MRRLRFLPYLSPTAALAFALAAAGCGSTSPGLKEGVEGAFIRAAATWDLNHDGNVTCDEWKQYAASVFNEADVKHEGKLTRDGFARLAKIDRLFLTANFEYFDTDKKGFVTLQDITGKPNPAFTELDKENTCVIKTHQLRSATMPDEKRDNPGMPAGGSHGGGH